MTAIVFSFFISGMVVGIAIGWRLRKPAPYSKPASMSDVNDISWDQRTRNAKAFNARMAKARRAGPPHYNAELNRIIRESQSKQS